MIYMQPFTHGLDDAPAHYGVINSPYSHHRMDHDCLWCADNGAFTKGFNWPKMVNFLTNMERWVDRCVFVACPDVVCDAIATMALYRNYAWRIKAMGWPVAFVAQDGQEQLPLPPEYDALFIGGSDDWKESPAVDRLISLSKRTGRWVHVGRVNSQRRIRHFQLVGVNSVDGTTLVFGQTRMRRILSAQLDQTPLFTLE